MAAVVFEWDEANLGHLEKHGFTREDAEAVITDPWRVRVDTYNARGERRYGVIGRGIGGDILHVVFVLRGGNPRRETEVQAMTKTATETVSRPEKTEDGFTIIYDLDSIPTFDDEGDEATFWDTHTYSEELLDKAVRPPIEGDDVFPPARARANTKRPVSIRFDDDTLTRLKKLAGVKKTNYQTLVKNFVNERLYEEEKREGVL